MIFRNYKTGDLTPITELFLIGETRHIRKTNYWMWANNSEKMISIVAEDKGKIIGHCSVVSKNIEIANEIIEGGFVQQLVVHPQYRNVKTVISLMEKVWKEARSKFNFVFADPNDNIWPLYQKLMEWEKVDEFYADIINTQNIINFFQKKKFKECKVERIYCFSNKLNDWSIMNKAKDLNWRFFVNPINYYFVFGVFNSSLLVGYIVLKLYYNGKKTIGHFIDYNVKDKDKNYLLSLIKTASLFLDSCNIDEIVFWNKKKEYKEIYNMFDIQKGAFRTNLGVKFLHEKNNKLLNKSNWSYTMALSDAF